MRSCHAYSCSIQDRLVPYMHVASLSTYSTMRGRIKVPPDSCISSCAGCGQGYIAIMGWYRYHPDHIHVLWLHPSLAQHGALQAQPDVLRDWPNYPIPARAVQIYRPSPSACSLRPRNPILPSWVQDNYHIYSLVPCAYDCAHECMCFCMCVCMCAWVVIV